MVKKVLHGKLMKFKTIKRGF